VIASICVFFAVVCLIRVTVVVAHPSTMRVFMSAPVLLGGVSFACQLFPAAIDRAVGVVNLSDLLHHILGVVVVTSALLFLKTWKPPHELARSTIVFATMLATLLIALLTAQWLTGPDRRVESLADAGEWQTLANPFGFTTVVFNGFMIVGFFVIAWQCIYGTRTQFKEMPALRLGLSLMGCGLLLLAAAQVVLDVRLFSQHDYARLTSLYWTVLLSGTLVYSVGIVLPVPTTALLRNLTYRRQLRRLDPLWRHLVGMFPAVSLATATAHTAGKLAVVANRRFIEIGDCLNRLSLQPEAMDMLRSESDVPGALGRYLYAVRVPPLDGEPAASILPAMTTVDADRAQVLLVAEAFVGAAAGHAPPRGGAVRELQDPSVGPSHGRRGSDAWSTS